MDNLLLNFGISLFFLIVALIIVSIPGFFLSVLLIPNKYRNNYFWVLAPFLGISFTIVVLQTCVYLDIPISLSAFPFLILVISGILLIYLKKKTFEIPKLPRLLLVLGLIILAANGVGYFAIGASNYLGYGWIDQYNYVATSQFLMDKPFSTSLDQVGNVPYLVEAIIKKDDRIGQSILQGFVAVLTFTNAKTAYGAISLLSPLLTYFSVWLLSPFLIKERWAQYGAALSAACIPGFALIHLQDFLSQALAVPFLLISPLIIYYALKEKDWRFVAIGILILAAIHSIYTEFTLLFIVLAICGGIWYILQTKEIVPSILIVASMIVGGILINIGYIYRSISVMTRGNLPNILPSIFPFSETVQGLGYLWFGYSGPLLKSAMLIFTVNFCAVILTIAAYVGIVNAVRKQKDVICVLLLIIVLFPLVLLSQSEPYPYQFYKMLMAVSPVLMLGVWTLLINFWEGKTDDSQNSKSGFVPFTFQKGPKIILICLLISSIVITGYIASFCITGGYRSAVNLANTNETIITYNTLEQTKDQVYIVSVSHPYPLAWIAYHGRNDQIFFVNKVMGDVPLEKIYSGTFSFNNISQFPRNATKLTVGAEYPQISPDETKDHLIAVIDNSQGMEGFQGSEFNWLGKQMKLDLYWQGDHDQNITLSYLSNPGPGDPDTKRIVNISMIEGKSQLPQTIETDGTKTVSVPLIIQPGLNIVEFKSVYPENASVIFPQDPREFLVHISQMKITGNP